MTANNHNAADAPSSRTNGFRRLVGRVLPFLGPRDEQDPKSAPAQGESLATEHAYDSRGNYMHRQPTGPDNETQFGMSGKAPVPAFAVPNALVAAVIMMARSLALHGKTASDIARVVTDGFRRHYGLFVDRFFAEARFLEESIQRLESERSFVTRERDARPLVQIKIEELSWPNGLKTCGIFLLLAVWVVTVTADGYNAARHVQPFIPGQSWLWSFISVSLVTSMIVGIDVLLANLSASRPAGQVRVAGAVTIVLLGLVWAALFAINFGGVFSEEFAPLSLGWQRALLACQIIAGIGFGVVVLNGAISLFDRVERILPDPVRTELDLSVARLTEGIRELSHKLGVVQGHQRELQACEDFLGHAAQQAFVTAQTEAQFIADVHAAELRFIENRRQLLLGGPHIENTNPKN